MARECKSASGKTGFFKEIITSLFSKKDRIDKVTTSEAAKELGMNRKNSKNFDRGNIERRFACRSSQSKRRKLEHRRGGK